ncbi:MAG: ribosome biogenesis GTPase Der, partial [candidate division Zixibacteria bacterium]|nr:ribosome biogenesis GTPase Der [candidate division Zixibacteria bacterium]
MSLPTVAIVGRPNVGKSSLFNRILRKQVAVVDEQSGVTRDRNYAAAEWNGVDFYLIDTGGMVPETDDMMEKMIFEQADFAVGEADLVLFVVDTQVGADNIDFEIARRLHRSRKKCLLIANKADNDELENETYEFLKFGLGDPLPVSATAGRGVGEFLDAIVANLPEQTEEAAGAKEVVRVAVVGRPNVGKSSFINELIGRERLIVTPLAGTTRDAVDTPFELDGQKYVLVDTAGLR